MSICDICGFDDGITRPPNKGSGWVTVCDRCWDTEALGKDPEEWYEEYQRYMAPILARHYGSPEYGSDEDRPTTTSDLPPDDLPF